MIVLKKKLMCSGHKGNCWGLFIISENRGAFTLKNRRLWQDVAVGTQLSSFVSSASVYLDSSNCKIRIEDCLIMHNDWNMDRPPNLKLQLF